MDHWKALGYLIGYLKGKYNIAIFIIKPKVMKDVMFCDSNYDTDKKTGKNVRRLVATLGWKLLLCLSKTQRSVTLSNTES